MKKIYIYLFFLAITLAIIGYYLGRMDNGPKLENPIDTSTIPSRFDE